MTKLDITNHLLCASVSCDGSESEDAVVQGSGVGYILEHGAKQLQQLLVVGLEGLWVGFHNFAEQQQTHLEEKKKKESNRFKTKVCVGGGDTTSKLKSTLFLQTRFIV